MSFFFSLKMNTEIENSTTCEVQFLLRVLNAKNVVYDSHSQGIATLQFVSLAALQAFTCLPC